MIAIGYTKDNINPSFKMNYIIVNEKKCIPVRVPIRKQRMCGGRKRKIKHIEAYIDALKKKQSWLDTIYPAKFINIGKYDFFKEEHKQIESEISFWERKVEQLRIHAYDMPFFEELA